MRVERKDLSRVSFEDLETQGAANLELQDAAVELNPSQESGAGTLERFEASFGDDEFKAWQDIRGKNNVTRNEAGEIFIRKSANDDWRPVEGGTNWSLSEVAGDVADYGADSLPDIGGSLGALAAGGGAVVSGVGLPAALAAASKGGALGRAGGAALKEIGGRALGVIDDSALEGAKRVAIGGAEGAVMEPIGLLLGEGAQKVASGAAKKLVRGMQLPESLPIIGGAKVGLAPIAKKGTGILGGTLTGTNKEAVEHLVSKDGAELLAGWNEGPQRVLSMLDEAVEIPVLFKDKATRKYQEELIDKGFKWDAPIEGDQAYDVASLYDNLLQRLKIEGDYVDGEFIPSKLSRAQGADFSYIHDTLYDYLSQVRTVDDLMTFKGLIGDKLEKKFSDDLAKGISPHLKALYRQIDDVIGESAKLQGLGDEYLLARNAYAENMSLASDAQRLFKDHNKALQTIRNQKSGTKVNDERILQRLADADPELAGIKERIDNLTHQAMMDIDVPVLGGTRVGAEVGGGSLLKQAAMALGSAKPVAYPGLVAAGKTGRAIGQGIESIGDIAGSKKVQLPIRGTSTVAQSQASKELRGIGEPAPPPEPEQIVEKAMNVGRESYGARYKKNLDSMPEAEAALYAVTGTKPASLDAAIKKHFAKEIQAYRNAGIQDGVSKIKTILGAE